MEKQGLSRILHVNNLIFNNKGIIIKAVYVQKPLTGMIIKPPYN